MPSNAQFAAPAFELTGGALCLDFANTGADHKAPETASEKIHHYADLLAFGVQSGSLSATDARKLLDAANHSASKAEAAWRKIRDVRETIYRVFSAAATGEKPARHDIEFMNACVAEVRSHNRLVPEGSGFALAWSDELSFERPLWPIVESAVQLLTSEDYPHVRQCGSAKCAWLFVDRSRNRTRRWCDMKVCGNRAKARRHYERVRS